MAKIKTLGFGYNPCETKQHFLVNIPAGTKDPISVYERFSWDEDTRIQTSELSSDACRCKVIVSRNKWKLVKSAIEIELNKRLKETNKTIGKFKAGQNPVERLLGKEMVLLLWAIEDCDPSVINTAIRNWLGLSHEERWWMFTMTNATTGNYSDHRGWRIAVRYALAENPIQEKGVQGKITELLYKSAVQ